MRWYEASAAPAEVPILDMEGLAAGAASPARFRAVADRIGEVLADGSGIFYVRGHGIEASLAEALRRVTGEFFAAPEAVRRTMLCEALPLRGYSGLGAESTAKVFGAGDHPDMCMKYSWTTDNVYPDQAFHDVWQRYQDAAAGVCRLLLGLIRQALGDAGRNHALWRQLLDGQAMIRHLDYPDAPLDDPAQRIHPERMAAHNDIGALTLLHQTPCANGFVSLQAEIGGRMVGIPAIRDTLVVNVGDVLVHLTGGKVKAVRHRVLQSPTAGGARTATLCFYFPNGRFDLRSLDGSDFQGLLDKERFADFAGFLAHLATLYCGKAGRVTPDEGLIR